MTPTLRPVAETPATLADYARIGGVLHVAFFEACDGSDAALRAGVARAVEGVAAGFSPVHRDAIPALRPRPVGRDAFLGPWCDPATGALIRRGTITLSDGTHLRDPTYAEIAAATARGATVTSSGGALPGTWGEGGFAYAFADPPYGFTIGPAEVQALFAEVLPILLPPGEETRILDWSAPALLDVSRHFAAGAEWWGVFLWTLHRPATGRLTVIVGSATD